MQAKLNPMTPTSPSSTSAVGKLNFPGFQEILDFTSAGSESSVSVAVDGDTDKEYKIITRNLKSNEYVRIRINGDTNTSNYGRQSLTNNTGTVAASRDTSPAFVIPIGGASGAGETTLFTPTGFIKTMFSMMSHYGTGTTVQYCAIHGMSYNNTANVTSITFIMDSGNFTAGTRITVYARRSN